ncbi:MAG: CvpA family protein [Chloroflexota bacterium]
MNWVDIAIVVLLALDVLYGLHRGFILEVATIIGVLAALAVAKADYSVVRNLLDPLVHGHPHWLTVVSYLIVFVVVWAAILVVAGRIRSLIHLLFLGWLDRLAGGFVGLIQGLILVVVLLGLAKHYPNHTLRHALHHSQLASSLGRAGPYVDHLLPHAQYY